MTADIFISYVYRSEELLIRIPVVARTAFAPLALQEGGGVYHHAVGSFTILESALRVGLRGPSLTFHARVDSPWTEDQDALLVAASEKDAEYEDTRVLPVLEI